jgi:hypothetical protein
MRGMRGMRETRGITNAQCPMPDAQCLIPQDLTNGRILAL